ncbi:MAG TPA: zinc-ribbon domain-containing protein [Thermoanaerobaculia bacterium]|jgi:hypothetical protein
MKITCSHCQRTLSLPDEKVPARPFAVTCPGCQARVQVDPSPPPAAAAAAADPAGEVTFEPLPPIRELDKELFDSLYPAAALVLMTPASAAPYEKGLRLLGMEEIHRFDDLAEAAEALRDGDFAVMLIVTDRAVAPPCPPLDPLYAVPAAVRRRTFTALAAGNVRSLDGQTAFYLRVHCLLSTRELAKFPAYLRQAFIYHLRRYRYWGVREE